MYIYIYICMYVCMYIYIHTYLHILLQWQWYPIYNRVFFSRSSWQLVSASPIPAISPATAHMKRRSSTLKPHCFSKVSFWGFKLSPWQQFQRGWWLGKRHQQISHLSPEMSTISTKKLEFWIFKLNHVGSLVFPETTICIQLLCGKSSVPTETHIFINTFCCRIPIAAEFL